MKNIYLIALVVIPFFTLAQNIEFQKIIDDDVQIAEYDYGRHALIRYQKVANEMILRFEDLKVQLYDIKFDRKWEINLDKLKGGPTDYSRFATAFDDDFIYIMQYNITSYLAEGTDMAQLHKIDYEGNIVKSIDFYELVKIDHVSSIQKEMLVIDEELFVFWNGSLLTDKLTGSDSELHLSNITILNSELTEINNAVALPHKIVGTEQSDYWYYDGIKDGNFIFRRFHSRDKKKGEYTTLVSSDNTRWYEYIEVTRDLEMQNFRSGNAAETEDFSIHLNGNFKYDTTLYFIEFEGIKQQIGELTHVYPLVISKPTANLFLYKGEKKSDNLIDGLIKLVDKNFKYAGGFLIKGIISDPINNSVNIIAEVIGFTFLFTFNDELKIIAIIDYMEGTKMGGANKFGHSYSYNYGCYSFKRIWGDLNSNHKINALEYSAQFGVKSHVTVINYDDYQVLILDSKSKGTCTVYKIVR